MTFVPANISASCQLYPSLPTCQPYALAFMTFLVQNLSHSVDEIPKKYENKLEEEYDFIVVGAGAAGCVIANRLSEEKNWKVLLLEAGDEQPEITSAPGFQRMFHGSSLDWGYKTQPEPIACAHHPDHRCPITQGKVMGGSSSLGRMYYLRGNQKDYDGWAKLNNTGWSYKDVFPYFLKSEDMRDEGVLTNESLESVWGGALIHDTGGYLAVERDVDDNREIKHLGMYWKMSWTEMGLADKVDSNEENQIGISYGQTTTKNGVRQSSNVAFLRPVRRKRGNLVVKAKTHVTRVILKDKLAVGVEYYVDGDKKVSRKVYARKEVIVSAGVFGSPKLLMLSGIGHAEELQKLGIEVVQDLPVGDNLHDHVKVPVVAMLLDYWSTIVRADRVDKDLYDWLKYRRGRWTHIGDIASLVTFVQSLYEDTKDLPDLQFYNDNAIIEDIEASGDYNGLPTTYYPDVYYDAFVVKVHLLNPKSRGTVRLNESNPTWEDPLIRLNFLAGEQDAKILVDGALLMEDILGTDMIYHSHLKRYERAPKSCQNLEMLRRPYLECMVRNYAEPALNFVGTCKMGPEGDPTAVVDPRLRVHGVLGLRVIDASVMPTVPRGSTFAPTVMIAEKGSDLIKEDWSEDGTPDEMVDKDWRESSMPSNGSSEFVACTSSLTFAFAFFGIQTYVSCYQTTWSRL